MHPVMEGLKEIVSSVEKELIKTEEKREYALAESRKIIRLSKRIIHSVHLEESSENDRKTIKEQISALISNVSDCQWILISGPLADAMMEYAEAEILCSSVYGEKLPSYEDLGITPQAWIMGMADTIGEIRRVIVTRLMNGRTDEAFSLFSVMEAMCEELLMFDVPDAILPIRRKQDVARGIVEKTRSDLMAAKLK